MNRYFRALGVFGLVFAVIASTIAPSLIAAQDAPTDQGIVVMGDSEAEFQPTEEVATDEPTDTPIEPVETEPTETEVVTEPSPTDVPTLEPTVEPTADVEPSPEATVEETPVAPTEPVVKPTATESVVPALPPSSITATSSASIMLTVTKAYPGQSVLGTVLSAYPGEMIEVRWGSISGPVVASQVASSGGVANVSFVVPGVAYGNYDLYVVGDQGSYIARTFEVVAPPAASIAVTPAIAQAGTTVTATGANFAPGEAITIRFGGANGPRVRVTTADQNGSFSTTFLVPVTAKVQGYWVVATGDSGKTSRKLFTVTSLAPITVSATPLQGQAGSTVRVDAGGFQPGQKVTIKIAGTVVATFTANSGGKVGGNVVTPSWLQLRSYWINVSGDDGRGKNVLFTVTKLSTPVIKASSTSGRAGSTITLTGSGFAANERVTVTYAGTTVIGTLTASSNGTISGKVIIPRTSGLGNFAITARGTSGQSARFIYRVTGKAIATIAVSPGSSRAASMVKVTGSGFAPRETVRVRFGGTSGTVIATTTASSSGSISVVVRVPVTAKVQTYVIAAVGVSGITGTTNLKIMAPLAVILSVSPTSARAETWVTVSGSGFGANESVVVRWNSATGKHLGSFQTDASGRFSGVVQIPSTSAGARKIVGTGSLTSRLASAPFTVLATPVAPTPTPPPPPSYWWSPPPRDYNCTDFSTQAEAQRYFNMYPGDPSGLDRDFDGIACESNPR